MPSSLTESQAIAGIADILYDFLPGKPHPYADPKISFPGAANKVGVGRFWANGSKRPAIAMLLQRTLDYDRNLFCPLIVEIVNRAFIYRAKGKQITRAEIAALNDQIVKVGFKIPELWNSEFLDSLPSPEADANSQSENEKHISLETRNQLKSDLFNLEKLEPQPRGFSFERFLKDLFDAYGLSPRSSFRLVGEQIDGSVQHEGFTYVVEARWQKEPIGSRDLYAFQEQVEGKSKWSRGLFICYNDFSEDGKIAFSKGRSTSIIGMNGFDLYEILDGKISLPEAISRKARRAAETGQFLTTVYELSLNNPG